MKYLASKDFTILEALGEVSPQSSKTTLRSWLKEERVTVDGVLVKLSNSPVSKGQEITVGAKPKLVKNKIPILYEDQHIVVIDKPEGLLSVATAFEKGETAHALLKAKYKPKKIYVIHRLDQNTSGVMIFALSEPAYIALKETFEKHDIQRSYCAIVEGAVSPRHGKWECYLYEDANYMVHPTEDTEKGRLAITHYQVEGINKHNTWLSLKLETGRKNQIRVHTKLAGHPIVGDKKYGAVSNPIQRLCLHASLLAFKHPITNKMMRFESPVPDDFYRIMAPKK
jgi:23S rRNA pseudouridine1911/1915/1917 synthase